MNRMKNIINDRNIPDTRIRFRFGRLEEAAAFSHLEQLRELRRRACAAGLPFCGKENNPRMSFSPIIPEGYTSSCEYADLYLYKFVSGAEAAEKMRVLDDNRYILMSAERIPVFFPALEVSVNAVKYSVEAAEPVFTAGSLNRFLDMNTCIYERVRTSGKIQHFDVRELYRGAEIEDSGRKLVITLSFCPAGANLRPELAANAIFGEFEVKGIKRLEFYWQNSKGEFEVF